MKLNVRADEYLYSSAPPIKSPKQRAISPIELSLLDCPRPWYTVNTDFFFFVTEFHIMMYTVCPGSNRSLSWAFVFNKHLIVEVTVIHDINKCMLMTR